jgi:large subunit ribosomal protein L5
MNFKNYYTNVISYDLMMKLNLKNIMEFPKIEKIILNIGYPNINQDKKQILSGLLALELISGQQAYATKSSKQVHSLKIRKNMFVGTAVTLRGTNMYFFLDKFITLIRNFKGFPVSYKKDNNFIISNKDQEQRSKKSLKVYETQRHITFKIKDLYVFPELEKEYHLFQKIDSIDMTIVFENKKVFKEFPNLSEMILSSVQFPFIEK